MERTFVPNRGYWIAFGGILGLLWFEAIVVLANGLLADDHSLHQKTTGLLELPFWFFLTFLIGCFLSANFYAILAYFRKRLVIGTDEIRCHRAILVRAIRFADVVDAQLSLTNNPRASRANPATFYRPHRLRLRTVTRELIISLDLFVRPETEDEILELLHTRLSPGVRQDWEKFQALREGRASPWSPPIFTLRRMACMATDATGIGLFVGALLGFLLFIGYPRNAAVLWASAADSGELSTVLNLPGAAKWPWSRWMLLDVSLYCGLWGLLFGIALFISLRIFEWAERKLRIAQGRRLERESVRRAFGAFQPSPDSRGG